MSYVKNIHQLVESFSYLNSMEFGEILQSYLEHKNRTKRELHIFLLKNDYDILKTSMDRYFIKEGDQENTQTKLSRLPDERFIEFFAKFLDLPEYELDALKVIRKNKRSRRGYSKKKHRSL